VAAEWCTPERCDDDAVSGMRWGLQGDGWGRGVYDGATDCRPCAAQGVGMWRWLPAYLRGELEECNHCTPNGSLGIEGGSANRRHGYNGERVVGGIYASDRRQTQAAKHHAACGKPKASKKLELVSRHSKLQVY